MESHWDSSYSIPHLWFQHPTCISIIRFDTTYCVSPQLPAIHLNPCLLSSLPLLHQTCVTPLFFLLTISGCHGLLDTHCYDGVVCERIPYFGIFIIINFCLLFPTSYFLGRRVLLTALLFSLYRVQLNASFFLKQ